MWDVLTISFVSVSEEGQKGVVWSNELISTIEGSIVYSPPVAVICSPEGSRSVSQSNYSFSKTKGNVLVKSSLSGVPTIDPSEGVNGSYFELYSATSAVYFAGDSSHSLISE